MKNTNRGHGVLAMVAALGGVATIFLWTASSFQKQNYDLKSRDYDQTLLNEVTTSAFAVMESALARRLWEPPPDSNCLKAQDFSAEGSLEGGFQWKVVANYNTQTKKYELESEGSYRGLKARYIKRIKVMDVSDYLLFSGGNETINLTRRYNENSPTALIARDRRVYTNGALAFNQVLARPSYNHANWSGSPSVFPEEFGTIVQGDRLQFGGGLYYNRGGVYRPNEGQGNLSSMLAPYVGNTPDAAATHYAQRGANRPKRFLTI